MKPFFNFYFLVTIFICCAPQKIYAQAKLTGVNFEQQTIRVGVGTQFYSSGFKIYNQGNQDAPESYTGFYISNDVYLSSEDVFLGENKFPALPKRTPNYPSYEYNYPQALTLPASILPGTYHLIYKMDNKDQINTDPSVGYYVDDILIVEPANYDLISNVYVFVKSLPIGRSFAASIRLKNNGNEYIPKADLGLFLSLDTLLSQSDVLLGSVTIDKLFIGNEPYKTIYLSIPESTPEGNYYLISAADQFNKINEGKENNNTFYVPFKVLKPYTDLISHSNGNFLNTSSGVYLQLKDKFNLYNNGNYTIVKPKVRVIMTIDTLLNPVTVHGKTFGLDSIGSSDYKTFEILNDSILIPDSTTAGRLYVGIWMDPENEVAETKESNNINWMSLIIRSKDTLYLPGDYGYTFCNFPITTIQTCKKVIRVDSLGFSTCGYFRNIFTVLSEGSGKALTWTLNEVSVGKDTFQVYDGTKVIGTFTGTTTTPPITSSTGSLSIKRKNFTGIANKSRFIGTVSCESPTGFTNDSNFFQETFQLFPNPVQDLIQLSCTEAGKLLIGDVTGKIIDTYNVAPLQLDVSHLQAGTYFLKFVTAEAVQVREIIIVR